MSQQPSISCIIPTFNRRHVLVGTIEMLLDQSSAAKEIVVVDQSTDIPPEVSSRLQSWHEQGRIKWVRQPEPNASMARNRGALESTGDVIVFLDDDIRVSRDFVASYQRAFADPEVRAVAGQVLEGGCETVGTRDPRADDPDYGWMFCKRNFDKPFTGAFLMAGNMGVRRTDFMAVGGMDEHYMKGAFREEADFAMRWRKSGKMIHFRPDVSLIHLAGPGIQDGGARHWTYRTPWTAMHHYFGSWYFLLNHATWRSLPYLLAVDMRSAGLNKRNLRKPWMIPLHLSRWLWALPGALRARIEGPRLIGTAHAAKGKNGG
ncbi:MAG: glycosyltransferase [Verrucomicrobiaceae bacterium]|nr:glycosyltransferase [Verrucomicrobiaceae bacterium]